MLTTTKDGGPPAPTPAPTIRQRREALGLTRVQLAVLADVSPTWLAQLEAGCLPKRSESLPRIERALDAQCAT